MQSDEDQVLEYDLWRWHIEGVFPSDQPREQAYVHIGVFVAWLADHDMLDAGWVARSGAAEAVATIRAHRGLPSGLRDLTEGRFAGDMLTPEGRGFTGAYYAPEYGYPRDWRRAFGRKADRYDVPDTWATYDWIAPLIDRRHGEWVQAGRPELMPLPRLLAVLMKIVRPRVR